MRTIKITGLALAAVATLAVGASPALARHGHKVCGWEMHHHHKVKTCHWVG